MTLRFKMLLTSVIFISKFLILIFSGVISQLGATFMDISVANDRQ